MRIQGNGLPLNCFNGTSQIKEQNIDFELFWNPAPGADANGTPIDKVSFDVNSNSAYSEILCKPDGTKNTNAPLLSAKTGSNSLDGAIGITLDGVLLMPALEQLVVNSSNSGSYVDTWFPDSKSYTNWSDYYTSLRAVDTCLGSISSTGEYHFRSASQCIGGSAYTSAINLEGLPCNDCYDSTKKVSTVDERIAEIAKPVIGLAKDGRVIYGPKVTDSTGTTKTLSACDIDVCNGRIETSGSDKIYTYRATTFHPYLPACFGPGKFSTPVSGA